MTSSFVLELDTTGPSVNVIAPNYTAENVITEIIIEGNEHLSPEQNFYFVDSFGQRYDVLFSYEGDSFKRLVNFENYPSGILTLHGIVKDDVLNPSAMISYSIEIVNRSEVALTVRDSVREMVLSESVRSMLITTTDREVHSESNVRNIDSSQSVRKMELIENGE